MTPILAVPILPNHADAAWFACLGLPLAPAELRDARGYLEALGYPPDTRIAAARDWRQAETITRDPDWDRTWWTREEAERERLMRLARAAAWGRTRCSSA